MKQNTRPLSLLRTAWHALPRLDKTSTALPERFGTTTTFHFLPHSILCVLDTNSERKMSTASTGSLIASWSDRSEAALKGMILASEAAAVVWTVKRHGHAASSEHVMRVLPKIPFEHSLVRKSHLEIRLCMCNITSKSISSGHLTTFMIRAKRPLLLGNSREGPTRPALHRQAVPSVAQQNADLATSHLLLPARRGGGSWRDFFFAAVGVVCCCRGGDVCCRRILCSLCAS